MSADRDRRTAGSVQTPRYKRAVKHFPVRAVLGAALATVASGAVSVSAETAAPSARTESVQQVAAASATPSTGFTVPAADFVLDSRSLVGERKRNKVVAETREALKRSGTAPLYAPQASTELILREAAVEALRKNLDIRRKGLAKAMTERALIEADAVFDPVFVASANAALTRKSQRTVTPEKQYKGATETVPVGSTDSKGVFLCSATAAALTQGAGKGQVCYVMTSGNRAMISARQYINPHPEGYYSADALKANDPSSAQPLDDTVYNGSVAIYQQLPWGASLNLSLSSRYQEKYYPLNTLNGMTPTFGNYHRPYYSTIVIGAALPLPYTKNFGPTAAGEFGHDYARTSIDAAELDVRSVINDTLLTVDTLYWQLVGSIGKMEAAGQSLARAEQLRASTKRLFDQGFVSESDRSQIDAQVASIRARQQQLFGDYVKASEAMRKVLAGTDDALLLPVGYQALMKRPVIDLHESDRILNNPVYQRQAVAVRLAGLVREQREAQTRPDLSASGSLTMAESGAFGYHDLAGSVSHAFTSQDSFVATIALFYQRPLGNRAALAGLDAAEHGLNQQAMALHQVELATRESFETARGALASAGEQVRIAERTVKVATEVYDSAVAQQELGLVAAYESLSRLGALLDARTALVQAEINRRLAESQLLAAVGGLAERYGELTAQTDLDRKRLALLRESGALKHFGGPL